DDAERSSSRVVSAPFAATMTARERCRRSFPSRSQYATPVVRPLAFVSTRNAVDSARTSQRPVATAFGMTVARVDDLAPNSHPYNEQCPHARHGERPSYCFERIANGDGCACSPRARAARSRSTPDDLLGSGGNGYARERGGSNGPGAPD